MHQDLAPIGDTYWVQMLSSPTPLSGTPVAISDTAPTGDRYNLSICEVLPDLSGGSPTWSISGAISPSIGGGGATVVLSGAANATIVADTSGTYTFTGVSDGTYTVTPSNPGYIFSPVSQTVINGAGVTGVNFLVSPAIVPTFSTSGAISRQLAAVEL